MALAHKPAQDDESGVLGCVQDEELSTGSYGCDQYTCASRGNLWSGGFCWMGEVCMGRIGLRSV